MGGFGPSVRFPEYNGAAAGRQEETAVAEADLRTSMNRRMLASGPVAIGVATGLVVVHRAAALEGGKSTQSSIDAEKVRPEHAVTSGGVDAHGSNTMPHVQGAFGGTDFLPHPIG